MADTLAERSDCLLTSPDAVPINDLGSKYSGHLPMPTAHGLPKQRQPCEGYTQALVRVRGVAVFDAYEALGILPARQMLLRSDVVTRLIMAEKMLPLEFGLMVLDGWRSLDEQRALADYYGDAAADEGCRPPHTTGGAVDLTLMWEGKPLALGTDYDSFDDAAASHAFEHPGADERIKLLRRNFAHAMSVAGFVSYEKEWWHWSYGDDVWAHAKGRSALYDIVGEVPF